MELGKKLASYVRDTMKSFRDGKGVVLRNDVNLSTQVNVLCILFLRSQPSFQVAV